MALGYARGDQIQMLTGRSTGDTFADSHATSRYLEVHLIARTWKCTAEGTQVVGNKSALQALREIVHIYIYNKRELAHHVGLHVLKSERPP